MINSLKIGDLTWRHLNNPTEEDFEFLKDRFHFHPLDIEDCKSVNQRPKIDIYDDYYFLILHFPNFDRQNKFVKIKEVKIFWGRDYIISIEKNPWGVSQLFDEYEERIKNEEELNIKTSDLLLYRILEKLMTESVYLLRKVGLDVELINRELLQEKQVKIIEEGWADANETPTHLILKFNSSCCGAFVGSPGNTFWLDNVKLVY